MKFSLSLFFSHIFRLIVVEEVMADKRDHGIEFSLFFFLANKIYKVYSFLTLIMWVESEEECDSSMIYIMPLSLFYHSLIL